MRKIKGHRYLIITYRNKKTRRFDYWEDFYSIRDKLYIRINSGITYTRRWANIKGIEVHYR